MKKEYEEATIEVIQIKASDIITDSYDLPPDEEDIGF